MNYLSAMRFLGLLLSISMLISGVSSKRHHHRSHPFCFTNDELEVSFKEIVHQAAGRNMYWDHYQAVHLVKTLEETEGRRRRKRRGEPENGCPNLKTSTPIGHGGSDPLSHRSISPWSYRIDYDENRYPQKLAFAQCLCKGCINVDTGKDDSSLNSVSVEQTMLVLRKKKCPSSSTSYMFELEYIKVPVACTCVIPRN
ncbi:interleukin-17C [Xenopus laevis]|uniref:Interleukin-17C n=1 Tax=Xenopus laevis TaxID=8355 RepID=A0A8J0TW20_XENLA|nr:interleukin-17C [Xenopus laevis]OCT58600.1 hypothetical protein XELAEV_18001924mg [Xenopus laevis]